MFRSCSLSSLLVPSISPVRTSGYCLVVGVIVILLLSLTSVGERKVDQFIVPIAVHHGGQVLLKRASNPTDPWRGSHDIVIQPPIDVAYLVVVQCDS